MLRSFKEISKFHKNFMNNSKTITLATKITIVRIIVTPIIIASIIWKNWGLALWLTLLAGVSDILDGALARSKNEKTHLGSILDPLADKLLTLSCYFTLAIYEKSYCMVPYWFFWLIFIKELILVLGTLFLLNKNYIKIDPSIWGKAAMMGQTVLLNCIFLFHYFKIYSIMVYNFLFNSVLFLVLFSLYQYAKIGIKHLILYFVTQK